MKKLLLIFLITFVVVASGIWFGYPYLMKYIDSTQLAQVENDTETGQEPAKTEEKKSEKQKQGQPKAEKSDQEEKSKKAEGETKAKKETKESESKAEDKKSGEPNEPAPPADPLESINLNNVEMKVIIQTIGNWTGKPVIPTSDDVMKPKITIYYADKLPRSAALSLVYDALRAKGIIAEQAPDKIYLKPLAQAKLGSVPTISAEEPLARLKDKSQVVEKYFRLENYSPSRLAEVITPLTAEYGHVTAIENTGIIAVIDTVENLMRIERIIKQLDVPESEQIVEEIFVIEKGDPVEIVQILELILSGGNRRRPSGGRSAQPAQNTGATPASVVSIEMAQEAPRLIPVPKHNWIIARASAEDIKRIGEWIKKLDISETVESEQTIIPIQFADVRDVVRLVNNAIDEMPGARQLRTSVVVEGLPESRQVVVFGSEENRKMVERLVMEIDQPADDLFEDKTFDLKHADPDEIKENLEGLYEQSYGSFSTYSYSGSRRTSSYRNVRPEDTVRVISFPSMKQITVIASRENMTKIEKQIAEWDVPFKVDKEQYRIIPVKNSDPVQLVELLRTLFSEDDGSSGGASILRIIFGGYGDEESKKKIVGSLYGTLTFEAVPDTKKIIVISKIPEAYDVIEKLIMELDSQEKAEVPRVITLKYADAEDLCDQLNAILNEAGTTATIRRSTRGLSVDTLATTTDGDSSGRSNNPEANRSDVITPWWDRQRLRDNEMPTSNLIGNIRIIPVHRSKAILVLAPPEYLDDIENMIIELDQPGKQVMIKAIILQVDHGSMTSLGFQISSNPAAYNVGEDAINVLNELTNATTFGSFDLLGTTINANILIDLLVKQAHAKILNQPTLWTKDNEEAMFIRAQNIAFLASDQTDSTGQSVTQSYEYRDIGVTLRVRPNITPEKAVDMTISMEISEIGTEEYNAQPAVGKFNTTTHLIVNDGQTILLGGILFQKDTLVHRKVPILGDIPIAGALFSHEETNQSNSELLAFITPYVIDDNTSKEALLEMEKPKKRMESVIQQLDELFEEYINETEQTDDIEKTEPEEMIKPDDSEIPDKVDIQDISSISSDSDIQPEKVETKEESDPDMLNPADLLPASNEKREYDIK